MALTKIITDTIDLSADTTALKIPKGTTAERLAGTTGMIRENTDTGNVEVYNGADWRALQQTGQDTGVVGTNNFDTAIYSTAASPHAITGLNFQPDLTWVKSRDYGYANILGDSVRTVGSDKMLVSDFNGEQGSTDGAYANAQLYGYISSLDATGFTGTAGSGGSGPFVGASGSGDYVSWNWKAGGNANTFNKDGTGYASAALAGLTAGTLTSTGSSVNTEAGFSIINYTGNITADASFPHGLSSQPDLVIIKNKAAVEDWCVYSSSLAASENLYLNTDAAAATDNHIRSASATTVTVSDDTIVNSSTASSMIAYSWTSIPGYSLIGSYEGSGLATDTPIIYTGFKPAWIMVKRTDSTGDWNIVDDKRSTSDPRTIELAANSNVAETTPGDLVNFDNEGFQIITTDAEWNAENGDYIFMCFAS